MDIAPEFQLERIIVDQLPAHYIESATRVRARDQQPLACFTDFGATKNTLTCAVLVTTIQTAFLWSKCVGPIWRRGKQDAVEYKRIRTSQDDLEWLQRYLQAANGLDAALLTVTTKRSALHFSDPDDSRNPDVIAGIGEPLSKPMFERLRFAATVMTAALAPFDPLTNYIHWISDRDELFDPADRSDRVQIWCSSHFQAAFGREMLAYLKREHEIGNQMMGKDLLGIPDVAAGGIAEYNSATEAHYGCINGLYTIPPPEVREKARMVAAWFGLPRGPLAKAAVEVSAIRDAKKQVVGYGGTAFQYSLVPSAGVPRTEI